MCGLCGVAGNYISKSHFQAFETLHHASAVRGWDASGVAVVYKDKGQVNWQVFKELGPSVNVLADEKFVKVWEKYFDLKALIGHTRSATIGKNSERNAHPFEFEHVVGAHNGTLSRRPHNQAQYETDSEALYADINARGVEKAIPDITGAYALTWFDKFQGTINFLRNEERPLFLAVLKHSDTLFWASESELLEWALRRHGLALDTMIKLATDRHVKFKLLEDRWLGTYAVQEVKSAAPVHQGWARQLPFVPEEKKEPDKAPKSNVVTLPEKKKESSAKKHAFKKGFRGEIFSLSDYDALLSLGCQYCGQVPQHNTPIRWIEREEFLCEECKDFYTGLVAVH